MMSNLLCALVATIAIANAQTYEECGTAESLSGYTLTVSRDSANSMVKIDISGAESGWFGYGFGTSGMNNAYAVTVEGADSDNLDVAQRVLSKGSPPGSDVDYGTYSVVTSGGTATGTLEMAYDAADFDFTDFLTCQVDSIPIIIGKGGTTSMGYHGGANTDRLGSQTLTRTCACDTDNAGTPAPVTPAPVTPAPVTPSPEAPLDEDIVCGTSELIDDITLTLYKNEATEKVTIEVSGPTSQWFGYGFGSGMNNAFAITVEGADSDNLGVAQRVLSTSSPPGTSKSYGTTGIATLNNVAVGSVTMDYDESDFDFTDFVTCQVDSINIIAARGVDGTTTISNHGSSNRVGGATLTRAATCCGDDPDSSANNIFNGFYVMIAAFIAYLLM